MKNNHYVPIEKRSKKEQKAIAAKRRGSWHGVKPFTQIISSQKRKKLEAIQEKEASYF